MASPGPSLPPTALFAPINAGDIALRQGLHYVYTGNVHQRDGDTSFCPLCHAPLIVRDWYAIRQYRLSADGCCPDCGAAVAGRFGSGAGGFGRRRIPIAMGRA